MVAFEAGQDNYFEKPRFLGFKNFKKKLKTSKG